MVTGRESNRTNDKLNWRLPMRASTCFTRALCTTNGAPFARAMDIGLDKTLSVPGSIAATRGFIQFRNNEKDDSTVRNEGRKRTKIVRKKKERGSTAKKSANVRKHKRD